MLYWTLVFLVIALIAGVLGFTGVAVVAAAVAKLLFVVFLVLFVISLMAHLGRRGRSGVDEDGAAFRSVWNLWRPVAVVSFSDRERCCGDLFPTFAISCSN